MEELLSRLELTIGDFNDEMQILCSQLIKKQEERVANMNIPTYEEIAKMDWSDIHLTIQRLEDNL